jgi:hypothetical protein
MSYAIINKPKFKIGIQTKSDHIVFHIHHRYGHWGGYEPPLAHPKETTGRPD